MHFNHKQKIKVFEFSTPLGTYPSHFLSEEQKHLAALSEVGTIIISVFTANP